MKNYDKKLYMATIIGTLLALILMVANNYYSFYTSMSENMETIGMNVLARETQNIESYLSKNMDVLQTTAISVEHMLQTDYSADRLEEILIYESQRYSEDMDENFTGLYGYFKGEHIDGMGWVPDEGYVSTERDWYIAAMEAAGETTLVSPYVDAKTGNVMISISKLLLDNESVISVDVALDEIQNITESINIDGMGYAFVIDDSGLVVAHSDVTLKGEILSTDDAEMIEVAKNAFEQKQNCFEINVNGEKCVVFTDTILDKWRVVLVVDNDELLYEANLTLKKNIIICVIICIFIIFSFVFTMSKINQSMEVERKSNKKIEDMNNKVIRALTRTIDAKDRYTNGHSLRVAEYSVEIARRMNKSEEELNKIYCAGLLHDVGKIRVPEEVINKPGKLSDEEFEQIKLHPVTGYHILKEINDDKMIAMGAKFHHERYDGKGYPNGLKGENIPEIARIIGVADTYDAMASNRSYRSALSQEKIRSEIEKGKGTQFDPQIADIMLQMIDEDVDYLMKEKDSLKKILVIDDEPMNLKMIEFILKDEPMYETICAFGGREGLKILKQKDIDLILLDVKMPGMDGFETLSGIRKKYDVPVVFMTGEKNFEIIQRASEFAVDDYITKPFLPLALKEVIHSMLNN